MAHDGHARDVDVFDRDRLRALPGVREPAPAQPLVLHGQLELLPEARLRDCDLGPLPRGLELLREGRHERDLGRGAVPPREALPEPGLERVAERQRAPGPDRHPVGSTHSLDLARLGHAATGEPVSRAVHRHLVGVTRSPRELHARRARRGQLAARPRVTRDLDRARVDPARDRAAAGHPLARLVQPAHGQLPRPRADLAPGRGEAHVGPARDRAVHPLGGRARVGGRRDVLRVGEGLGPAREHGERAAPRREEPRPDDDAAPHLLGQHRGELHRVVGRLDGGERPRRRGSGARDHRGETRRTEPGLHAGRIASPTGPRLRTRNGPASGDTGPFDGSEGAQTS